MRLEPKMVFDMVIPMSSILSRLTIGQILELRAGRLAMERGVQCDWSRVHVVRWWKHQRRQWHGYLQGSIMRRSAGGRVYLLQHLTNNKHYFTRVESSRETKYHVGRSKGGSMKLGDMEMQALISAGLSNTVQELARHRDMMKVSVCCHCNRHCMLCDCKETKERPSPWLSPMQLWTQTWSALSLRKEF